MADNHLLIETDTLSQWVAEGIALEKISALQQNSVLFVSVFTAGEILQLVAGDGEKETVVFALLGMVNVLGIPSKYAKYATKREYAELDMRDFFTIILLQQGKLTVLSERKEFFTKFSVRCIRPEKE